MDRDGSNILYIVITLIAVIVGLPGKKKKPAPGGAGNPGNSARPGFLENLERVLNMNEGPMMVMEEPYEEEVEQSPPVEVARSAGSMKEKHSLIEEYYQIMNRTTDAEMELMDSEGEGATGSMEIIDLDEGSSGTDYFEIIENFDAGKAVVYSSIIDRLDY